MTPVIQVSGLSKIYRLGEIGTGTISQDLERWYKIKIKGQEDPFLKIGESNERNKKGISDIVYSLNNIDLEVRQGEALGIIGKNGAGKSTLLKILSRVTSPTAGKINIKGRIASLLEVGTGFHPELTGRENIFLNGAILGMRKKEITRKLDEIIDFSGVERYIDTPVKRYSSGMYVRLAFAVAAHLESEILIVDEVLAVGDVEFQEKCLGKMRDLSNGEGRTVLFVSHNMISIAALCQRAILLEDGRFTRDGEASTVVENYLSQIIKTTEDKLIQEKTTNIRSVKISNSEGNEADRFSIGEMIIFEIELFNETFLDKPRVSININTPHGERLATIHTDVQQNSNWAFQGTKRIQATWKNNCLVPDRYRIDISLWGYSHEIEYLPGIKYIEIIPKDIYGTGLLPDPSFQGHILLDAGWDMNIIEFNSKKYSRN